MEKLYDITLRLKKTLICFLYIFLVFASLSFKTSGYVYKKRRSKVRRPVYTIEDITYDNPTDPSYIQGYTKINSILAPKLGISISSFTSCVLQCSLFKPQFSAMGVYRITPNIGIYTEISLVTKGTRDMPLDLPIAVKKMGKEGNEMIEGIYEQVKDGAKKLIFKQPEYYSMTYINVPIAFCFSFKGHAMSTITNHFIMGGYAGYLISHQRKRYEINPIEIEDDKIIYEPYIIPTKSKNIPIKELNKFEFGYTIGYMFETKEGMIFGIKYSESLNKIFKLDHRDFELRRRNMSIEIFCAFNILSLL